MKRILLVYNPHSSRYEEMRREVFGEITKLKGYMVGKYEVEKTNVDKNAIKFARIVTDGDVVIAVGGDATAAIAANGILRSAKDAVLAVLPYGNFNDLARTLGVRRLEDLFSRKTTVKKLYPLKIVADGRVLRYATCYATMGMMAEAVKIFDKPKMRKVLRSRVGRLIGSYVNLAKWYFRNKSRKVFVPRFKLNGVLQEARISDYMAVNGKKMARVMRGGDDWCKNKGFRSQVSRLTSLWRLIGMMVVSMVKRVPGNETTRDIIEFLKPSKVEVQAEGEYLVLEGVEKIEISKSETYLKVISIQK